MHIVLVHGWSVFDTATYGELPDRLLSESKAGRLKNVTIQNVSLSQYVSFRDEVRVSDLAAGFEAAFRREIEPKLKGERFACITHSTGGPVIRHWWWRMYQEANRPCPMSHLIMLAPANFGSALAQLGKSRLSRLRSWLKAVEPGQGILDWLEHGSDESWELNRDWILGSAKMSTVADIDPPVYPFVLTGQSIDRTLYDHLNSYTGESGSDGTVRCAAANLNATYLKLKQRVTSANVQHLLSQLPQDGESTDLDNCQWEELLQVEEHVESMRVAFRLIRGATHVGSEDGILFSVQDNGKKNETVDSIIQCLNVDSPNTYEKLCDAFSAETADIREKERVERAKGWCTQPNIFHDAHSLVILRFRDHTGQTLTQLDFKLLGPNDDPNRLPANFLEDRQMNQANKSTLTFFINYDVMNGLGETTYRKQVVREALKGISKLGMRIYAQPLNGIVRYYPGIMQATKQVFGQVLRPDQTTLIDVEFKRLIGRGAFELVSLDGHPKFEKGKARQDFRKQQFGGAINPDDV
ncbi:esterase/lipase family protein [Planctomicrobium piriforme]|uniref:Phospholipase n=1 Tax=Planctomicrobium piriforme TaxID=1576369 RepID=A0A1I3IHT8_9PLAN|nr:hypothetical protein [Planctomicrobium piriforme]SFI47353.1 hypothetical protein SAMN05421753_109124 [Planctomicrobium piriforme]